MCKNSAWYDKYISISITIVSVSISVSIVTISGIVNISITIVSISGKWYSKWYSKWLPDDSDNSMRVHDIILPIHTPDIILPIVIVWEYMILYNMGYIDIWILIGL